QDLRSRYVRPQRVATRSGSALASPPRAARQRFSPAQAGPAAPSRPAPRRLLLVAAGRGRRRRLSTMVGPQDALRLPRHLPGRCPRSGGRGRPPFGGKPSSGRVGRVTTSVGGFLGPLVDTSGSNVSTVPWSRRP